jgi:hypothetical protein
VEGEAMEGYPGKIFFMYRVEFYRWSELKQQYELIRTYWTAKDAIDQLAGLDLRTENTDRQVYRYDVYGVPGIACFVYYSIDNNRFTAIDTDKRIY